MKFNNYINEMPKGIYKRKKKFPKDGFKKLIKEMENSGYFKRLDYKNYFFYDMDFKYKNIVFPMEIGILINDISEIGSLTYKLFAAIVKPHRVEIVNSYSYTGWYKIYLGQDDWSSEEYMERILDEIEGNFQKEIKRNLDVKISHWSIGHTQEEVLNMLKTGKYEI